MVNCVVCGRPASTSCQQCGRVICRKCAVPMGPGQVLCPECASGRRGGKVVLPPDGPRDYEGPRSMG